VSLIPLAYYCGQSSDLLPAAIASASAMIAFQKRNKDSIIQAAEQSNSELINKLETQENEYKKYQEQKDEEVNTISKN